MQQTSADLYYNQNELKPNVFKSHTYTLGCLQSFNSCGQYNSMASAYSQFLDSQYPMSNDVSNSINISALDDWMESGFYVIFCFLLLLL